MARSPTRRDFLTAATLGGVSLAVIRMSEAESAVSGDSFTEGMLDATGERMASTVASRYRAYRSRTVHTEDARTWVQIDLGSSQPIEAIKLYPAYIAHWPPGDGFPKRFRVECSDDQDFASRRTIADRSRKDYPPTGDAIVQLRASKARGRYVRVTATKLREQQPSPLRVSNATEAMRKEYLESIRNVFFFSLARIEVLVAGVDVARARPVSVDAEYGNPSDAQQLTRPARPQGEGTVTDTAANVMARTDWKPVSHRASVPFGGVRLQGGLFHSAMQNTIQYLLRSSAVDDLLAQFRVRAGRPGPPPGQTPHPFWDIDLAGSSAARFLMGAGSTLRWMEDGELRQRLNAVVEGVAECREANGYIMAYPEEAFFESERGAYTRAWVTHGLIEAGYAGNGKAFELLRGYYDWFNRSPYLSEALRRCNQGGQGMVANTRLYFSPIGQPADLEVVQRYFQENYWLDALAAGQSDVLGQYPYDRAHIYLLTNLEAYLDLYRATGSERYLKAVLGAWALLRRDWQYTGGSFSLIEYQDCIPQSSPLKEPRGETCGNAFWVLLNHRLHLLHPEEERYVAEIERSIYNVLLANQAGSQGVRYSTALTGRKVEFTCMNSCCEGQATRLLASLPGYVYSVTENGLYVNLFEPSAIEWQCSGEPLRLEMQTSFPNGADVKLTVGAVRATRATIHLRVPSWAAKPMQIDINGAAAGSGTPASYFSLERVWSPGDVISFRLPLSLTLTRYMGVDRPAGRERFALQYGPVLMAALGDPDEEIVLPGAASPLELSARLERSQARLLHFTLPGTGTRWVPYFEVDRESFSCFPVITAQSS